MGYFLRDDRVGYHGKVACCASAEGEANRGGGWTFGFVFESVCNFCFIAHNLPQFIAIFQNNNMLDPAWSNSAIWLPVQISARGEDRIHQKTSLRLWIFPVRW